MKKPESFDDFWPHYLSQRRSKRCRILHYTGSVFALGLTLVFIISSNLAWLVTAFIAGYGFAWLGHSTFERNRPDTFQYPIFSLVGDFRMSWAALRGRLMEHYERHKSPHYPSVDSSKSWAHSLKGRFGGKKRDFNSTYAILGAPIILKTWGTSACD